MTQTVRVYLWQIVLAVVVFLVFRRIYRNLWVRLLFQHSANPLTTGRGGYLWWYSFLAVFGQLVSNNFSNIKLILTGNLANMERRMPRLPKTIMMDVLATKVIRFPRQLLCQSTILFLTSLLILVNFPWEHVNRSMLANLFFN